MTRVDDGSTTHVVVVPVVVAAPLHHVRVVGQGRGRQAPGHAQKRGRRRGRRLPGGQLTRPDQDLFLPFRLFFLFSASIFFPSSFFFSLLFLLLPFSCLLWRGVAWVARVALVICMSFKTHLQTYFRMDLKRIATNTSQAHFEGGQKCFQKPSGDAIEMRWNCVWDAVQNAFKTRFSFLLL